MTTPTVEEKVEEFAERFPCISNNCDNNGTLTVQDVDGEPTQEQCEYCHRQRFEDQAWLRTTLTTYGQSRYEEGVKAERERCKNLVVTHLRTNTYDGNDARVFKTTIEEIVGLLFDNK